MKNGTCTDQTCFHLPAPSSHRREGTASRSRRVDGVTLVELMVSMTIALIILAALSALFLTSRATYRYTEGMSRVQEGGRFATEFIAQDVRMAGYTGCMKKSMTVYNHLNTTYGGTYGVGTYLVGHTYTGSGTSIPASDWTPPLPTSDFATNEVLPYTDVITIRRGSENTARLTAKMTPDSSAAIIMTGNSPNLRQFDIVLVGNCERADLFQITGPASLDGVADNNLVHNTGVGTPGNFETALSVVFDTDAEIMKLITRVYYIGRRGGNVTDTTKPPALFRKELSGGSFVSQELVEGVENMKVAFGVDSDGDNNSDGYYRANALPTAWQNVVSARIGLLVQTTESADSALDTKTYDVAGFAVDPTDDRRRRHVYTTTIQIRNP